MALDYHSPARLRFYDAESRAHQKTVDLQADYAWRFVLDVNGKEIQSSFLNLSDVIQVVRTLQWSHRMK